MRRAAGTRDNHFDAALFGGRGVLKKKIRRTVCRYDACFMWNTEFGERVRRVLQRFPIRRRTHDDADQRRLRGDRVFCHSCLHRKMSASSVKARMAKDSI